MVGGLFISGHISSQIEMKYYGEGIRKELYHFVNCMSEEGSAVNALTDTNRGGLKRFASIHDGRVMVLDRKLRVVYDSEDLETGKTFSASAVVEGLIDRLDYISDIENDNYHEYAAAARNAETSELIGIVILRASHEDYYAGKEEMQRRYINIAIIMSIIFISVSILVNILTTRGLRQLNSTLKEMSIENTESEISVRGLREVQELSDSINRMTKSMSELEESRRRFVSDVSHELKTPMTSMKLLADSLLEQESAPESLYREFLTDIDSEIERENKIINDLLELVREEQKKEELAISKVKVNDMLTGVVKRLIPIANQRDVKLVYDSFREVYAEIDATKLSLAVTNIIENAIKYNHDKGWVHVTLDCDHKYFVIIVADSGIGIPEEAREHIFERFYRVDKTRSRETGGTGLGLAISKNIVAAHSGTIRVMSIPKEGSTFTIKLPLLFTGTAQQGGGAEG